MEKCLSCLPVRWPGRKTGRVRTRGRWEDVCRWKAVNLKRYDIWSGGQRGIVAVWRLGPLTERVASWGRTLHVKIVAFVESSSFGSMGEVVGGGLFERQLFRQSLVLLLWNNNIVVRRHVVIARTGNVNIWLRGWGVACWGPRGRLVPVRSLFCVCWASWGRLKIPNSNANLFEMKASLQLLLLLIYFKGGISAGHICPHVQMQWTAFSSSSTQINPIAKSDVTAAEERAAVRPWLPNESTYFNLFSFLLFFFF